MERINWEPIKAEYITTDISQRELADKYGVSTSALRFHIAAEQWGQLRQQHRRKIAEKTSERCSEHAAERMAQLMGGTDKMLDAALEALDDPQQFYRYLVKVKQDGETYTEEQTFKKADTKAMKDMTKMLRELTDITRDLYGLPDYDQQQRQRLAEEKLALEKLRLDADGGAGQTIEVVFAAGPEEWNE